MSPREAAAPPGADDDSGVLARDQLPDELPPAACFPDLFTSGGDAPLRQRSGGGAGGAVTYAALHQEVSAVAREVSALRRRVEVAVHLARWHEQLSRALLSFLLLATPVLVAYAYDAALSLRYGASPTALARAHAQWGRNLVVGGLLLLSGALGAPLFFAALYHMEQLQQRFMRTTVTATATQR